MINWRRRCRIPQGIPGSGRGRRSRVRQIRRRNSRSVTRRLRKRCRRGRSSMRIGESRRVIRSGRVKARSREGMGTGVTGR